VLPKRRLGGAPSCRWSRGVMAVHRRRGGGSRSSSQTLLHRVQQYHGRIRPPPVDTLFDVLAVMLQPINEWGRRDSTAAGQFFSFRNSSRCRFLVFFCLCVHCFTSVHCFESSDQFRRAPNEFTNPISKYRLDVRLFLGSSSFQ
jgi:hypothetical protein